MEIDPNDPDSFIPIYKQNQIDSLNIYKELLNESKLFKINTVKFFEDIEEEQKNLSNSQKNIHKGVRSVEEKWSATDTVNSRFESYKEAIDFFNQTEKTIKKMSDQMNYVVDKVSKPPL